ncbi:MAG: putative metal-dependent hydrolase [Bacteroidetes Order II. Incertae sedis bacterium]|nr:putative metal-dependent hydrolase [Bacteroidetes Order II. bacterium]
MLHSEKINRLRVLPHLLENALYGLEDAQLDTPYRPLGWTIRQVVHHLADSHMNAYIRCKLTLTEENPTIRPYNQNAWAELPDGRTAPIDHSLAILRALHARWADALTAVTEADWKRPVFHPDNGPSFLEELLDSYVAHGEIHVAQITGLRQRMNWI